MAVHWVMGEDKQFENLQHFGKQNRQTKWGSSKGKLKIINTQRTVGQGPKEVEEEFRK